VVFKSVRLLFIFLLFSPIFISVENSGGIVFDRIGYTEGVYKVTFPISIGVIFFFAIRNYKYFLLNGTFLLTILFLIVSILTNLLTSTSQGYLTVIFKLLLFILALYSLESEFKRPGLDLKKYSPYRFLMIVLVITIASLIVYDSNYIHDFFYLIKQVAIYNFFQYYSFIFILLLGICAERSKVLVYSVVFCFSVFLSLIANNTTSLLLTITFSLFYYSSLILNRTQLKQASLVIINFFIFFVLLYYFASISILEYFALTIPETFFSRIEGVIKFFNHIELLDAILPFQLDKNMPGDFYHNESLSILSTLGLIGVIGFYLIILKKIILIKRCYPYISISIALVVFIAGIVVVPILHPYTGIVLAYIIAYYTVKSKENAECMTK